MRSYASHLLQHIGGNASQARLKCIAKCDAIPDKLCPDMTPCHARVTPHHAHEASRHQGVTWGKMTSSRRESSVALGVGVSTNKIAGTKDDDRTSESDRARSVPDS